MAVFFDTFSSKRYLKYDKIKEMYSPCHVRGMAYHDFKGGQMSGDPSKSGPAI